jgi:hypothetical protein
MSFFTSLNGQYFLQNTRNENSVNSGISIIENINTDNIISTVNLLNINGNTSVGTNSFTIGKDASNNGYGNCAAIGVGAINTENNQIVLGTVNESVYIPGSLLLKTPYSNSYTWDGASNYTNAYYLPNGFTIAYGYCVASQQVTTVSLNISPGFSQVFCGFITKTSGISINASSITSLSTTSMTVDPDWGNANKGAFFWTVFGKI